MSNLTRFNSLFDDSFFSDFFRPLARTAGERMPAIDVHENEGNYLVKVDLPGVKKEDIKVSLDNGVLSIRAQTQSEETEEKEGKLIRQERHYGEFLRQLSVGSDVDATAVKAQFDNGVLSLSLPKQRALPDESRQISIE